MTNITDWIAFQIAEDVGGIGAPWSDPGGALAPGGGEASSGPIAAGNTLGDGLTAHLRVADPSTEGQLPAAFQLLGVEVETRGRWEGVGGSVSGSRDMMLEALLGSSVIASLGSCEYPISDSPAVCVTGGPTETMGFGAGDASGGAMGFRLRGSATGSRLKGDTLFIDSVRMRFHWRVLQRGRSRTREAFTRGPWSALIWMRATA